MKNITISIPDDVASWVRTRIGKNDADISEMLTLWIREKMKTERDYQSAMQTFLEKLPRNLSNGSAYPSRESLYQ